MNEITKKRRLVNAEQMLAEVFEPEARPSMRWLRSQTKAKSIPFFRIGHLIFFDVDLVRESLTAKNLVRHRMMPRAAQAVA